MSSDMSGSIFKASRPDNKGLLGNTHKSLASMAVEASTCTYCTALPKFRLKIKN